MRYSRDERATHVALWRESGLNRKAYSRQAEIPYHCLMAWIRAASASETVLEGSGSSGFVEVPRPERFGAAGPEDGLRLECGQGRMLWIGASADAEWAGRVVRQVLAC